jgi:hydrogenase nickel incorporation protein HypA/HybF
VHELEMIDKLINVVVDEAAKHNFTKINEVQLKVGRMNGLERHHFETAFTARPEDALKGTKLTIDEIPVKLKCQLCGEIYVDDRFKDPHFAHSTSHAPDMYIPPICPECGSSKIDVIEGKELTLASIDGE